MGKRLILHRCDLYYHWFYVKGNLVWALADFFNALDMVIPNVFALLALSLVVVAADRKAEAITKNVTQAYRAAEEK